MIKTKILQRDASVLRETARSVPVESIKSRKTREVIDKMKVALHAEADGVAIAAPQIGESLRMFIVNDKFPTKLKNRVFINPEIIKISKKKRRVEEGCLSVRYLYGQVKRSEKVVIRAYDETGRRFERGASGLLAQIFQHETDHLDGILFIDKAENIQDIPPPSRGSSPLRRGKGPQENIKFVFFGSSRFSDYVLEELEMMDYYPLLKISSAKDPLSIETLKKLKADVFVVASFGKILPKELIELPRYKTLNIHPSILPRLRGPAPIQGTILGFGESGITIIRMDEKVDHGPILAQARVPLFPWPDHYHRVEEKLGRAGGRMLGELLPKWIGDEVKESHQDDTAATYTRLIKKEDGLLDLNGPAEENLKKVLAYSTWPGAYMFFKNKTGREVRIIIKDAVVKDGRFLPTRVIPAGKREMGWRDFLRGN